MDERTDERTNERTNERTHYHRRLRNTLLYACGLATLAICYIDLQRIALHSYHTKTYHQISNINLIELKLARSLFQLTAFYGLIGSFHPGERSASTGTLNPDGVRTQTVEYKLLVIIVVLIVVL